MAGVAADPTTLDVYVRQKSRTALVALLVVVPIVATILAIEYRVMILTLLLLVPPIVPFSLARSARRQVEPGGGIGIHTGEHGVSIVVMRPVRDAYRGAPHETTNVPWQALPAAVVHPVAPSALVLVVQDAPNRFRRFIVPGPIDDVRAVAAVLSAHGTRIHDEPSMAKLGALLASALAWKVLGVVASVCVLGAMAQIGLAAMHSGGSYLYGVLLLVGALASLTVAALLRQWFMPHE